MQGAANQLFVVMHPDEQAIVDYCNQWPNSFISGREIALKVGGKERYTEDRFWANHILTGLTNRGILETDSLGHYRIKPKESKKKHDQPHISPQLLKILKSSGKKFEGVEMETSEDVPVIPPYPKQLNPVPPTGTGAAKK